jgi:glucokinase
MTPSKDLAIGIDFGGTTIKAAVVDGAQIVRRGTTIHTQSYSAQELIEALADEVLRLKAQFPDVRAAGLGLPGIVDSVNGIVHQLTNVKGWQDTPLRDILKEKTGLPIEIENDAKAMTYGEWKFGAGRNLKNVICLTLGTGVGGGLIIDGRLYRGSGLGAGEIGQMSIDYAGRPGNYGNLGALEKYVGNAQIAERALALYAEAGRILPPGEASPAALAAAARAGDPFALELWGRIGTEIGVACANVVWLLNPDCVILGGGVANAGELLFTTIRRVIQERTMHIFHEKLQVLPAELGTDAGMIGCAALAVCSTLS